MLESVAVQAPAASIKVGIYSDEHHGSLNALPMRSIQPNLASVADGLRRFTEAGKAGWLLTDWTRNFQSRGGLLVTIGEPKRCSYFFEVFNGLVAISVPASIRGL